MLGSLDAQHQEPQADAADHGAAPLPQDRIRVVVNRADSKVGCACPTWRSCSAPRWTRPSPPRGRSRCRSTRAARLCSRSPRAGGRLHPPGGCAARRPGGDRPVQAEAAPVAVRPILGAADVLAPRADRPGQDGRGAAPVRAALSPTNASCTGPGPTLAELRQKVHRALVEALGPGCTTPSSAEQLHQGPRDAAAGPGGGGDAAHQGRAPAAGRGDRRRRARLRADRADAA